METKELIKNTKAQIKELKLKFDKAAKEKDYAELKEINSRLRESVLYYLK